MDPATHTVKLCDFGSAKELKDGEPSVAYICSRYYRAPELIFEAAYYKSFIGLLSFMRTHACMRVNAIVIFFFVWLDRYLVSGMRGGRAVSDGAAVSRRAQRGSAGGDHQGAGQSNARRGEGDESALHDDAFSGGASVAMAHCL